MKALQNYIYRMRQESEAKRRRHALAWSVGITGFIFVLWLVNLQSTLSSGKPVVANAAPENDRSAVVEATSRMGRGWDKLRASVINSLE